MGGLVGSIALGVIFDIAGWFGCVAIIMAVLIVAGLLATQLKEQPAT